MRSKIRSSLQRLAPWIAVPLLAVGVVYAWMSLDPGFPSAKPVPEATTGNSFERQVRDYLIGNPEVIIESLQRFEAAQRAHEDGEAQTVLKTHADKIFREPASPVGGSLEGDVTLVEFFDYNCPYCRRVAGIVDEARAADPNLRIVYKEFPILGPHSVFAARAALAANRQGRYAEFHKRLMQARGIADEASALRIAEEIGLDVARLKSDMADAAIQLEIDRNLALAGALRIAGTPGFVVGRQIIRGATDLATLQKLIGDARKQ